MNEVIDAQAKQLRLNLAHFTGTENWYRHFFIKDVLYTDGVKYFAEHAGDHGA